VGPGPLGPIGTTPVGIIFIPCPPHPRRGARFVELGPARLQPQEGSGHEEGCPLPRIYFYFAFKMVYFGAFCADLLTVRDT